MNRQTEEYAMWDMNDVVDRTYVSGYTYHVTFGEGLPGDVDFSDYPQKGPVFAPLKDPGFFRKAFIEVGTIAWPNGADIAPKSLYEKLLQKEQNRKSTWERESLASHIDPEDQQWNLW